MSSAAGGSDLDREVLAAYGIREFRLSAVPSFSFPVSAVRSSAGDAYLKRYPATMALRARHGIRIASVLRRHRLGSPRYLAGPDGDPLVERGGSVHTLSWSLGETTLRETTDVGDEAVPRYLGRLHEAMATAPELRDRAGSSRPHMWATRNWTARVEQARSEVRTLGPSERATFRPALDLLADLAADVSALDSSDTLVGPVHGDFWPGNLVPGPTGSRSFGVIDFDNACEAPVLLDVAQYVDLGFAVFEGGRKVGFDRPAATLFAHRYAAARGLDREDLRLLPGIMLAARACSMLWIVERHLREGPSPLSELIHNDHACVRFLQQHQERWRMELTQPSRLAASAGSRRSRSGVS